MTDAQRRAVREWQDIIRSKADLQETDLYYAFRRVILETLLEFDSNRISTTPTKTVQEENIDFQITRGDGRPMLFVEAKGFGTGLDAMQNRPNEKHRTPVDQLWEYMTHATPTIPYGICTNYDDFWLFVLEAGHAKTQKVRFSDIVDDDGIREFVWLSKIIIIGDNAYPMHVSSMENDRDITSEFYNLFHTTRTHMISAFGGGGGNKAHHSDAVSTAQAFLNQLIFVFFAEDLKLVNPRLDKDISSTLAIANSTSSGVYDKILAVFEAYDCGGDGVPEFNGGLFSKKINRNMRFYDLERGTGEPSKIVAGILDMSAYNFKTTINVNILGHIFEQSISDLDDGDDSERKDEGIYYTPGSVTEYICNHTIIPYLSRSGKSITPAELLDECNDNLGELRRRLLSIRILDPACGSGAFLVKAAETILEIHRMIRNEQANRNVSNLEEWIEESRIRDVILHNIYGVDKSKESVGITKLAMFLKTAQIGEKLPVLDANIKSGNSLVRDRDVVSNPFDWDAEFPEIMNPENPDDVGFDVIIGNPPYIRQEKFGILKKSMQLPEPNNLGVSGFKIPTKSDISAYFFYHSLNLMNSKGRLGFIVSDSWMSTGYGDGLKRFMLDHSHIDLMVKPELNVFNEADVKNVIIILGGSGKTRIAGIRTHDELVNGMQYNPVELDDGNWNHHFMDSEFEPKIEMIKMSNVGEIKRGKVTGHKEFFVLGNDMVVRYGISKKFLVPLVTNAMRPGTIYAHNAKEYLLDVNETKGSLGKNGEEGVLRYIEDGEKTVVTPTRGADRAPRTIPNLNSIKSRKMWYSLGLKDPPAILIARLIDKRVKVYENDGHFHAINTFVYVTPHNKEVTHALLAYLSSSWYALYLERNGHAMGGGALSVETIDYKNSPVPDFNVMPTDDLDRLTSAWNDYCEYLDQGKLDVVVCNVLGFDVDEQKEINTHLNDAIKRRTKKE